MKFCENLIKNVSMYAEWWSCIHLQTHGQVEKVEHFQLKPTSMHQKASTKKWKEMKTKFSDYTVEVSIVPTYLTVSRLISVPFQIEKLRNKYAEIFQRAATDAPTTSAVVDIESLQEKQERTAQLSSQENVAKAEEQKKGWPRRIFGKLCCCCP